MIPVLLIYSSIVLSAPMCAGYPPSPLALIRLLDLTMMKTMNLGISTTSGSVGSISIIGEL